MFSHLHLYSIKGKRMELFVGPWPGGHDEEIAGMLIDLYEYLEKQG